jgi:hypothetical protein
MVQAAEDRQRQNAADGFGCEPQKLMFGQSLTCAYKASIIATKSTDF